MSNLNAERKAMEKVKNLIVMGAGGYARTVADIAEQLGYRVLAMLDDRDIHQPLCSFTDYLSDDVLFIPAFGNNEFRLQWCQRITSAGGKLATLIHPSAYVSPKATVGTGVVILPHAVINTGTIIGDGCIINLSAIVDHDCIIENGCHICLGAIVKGENRVRYCTKVEAGKVIERAAMQ